MTKRRQADALQGALQITKGSVITEPFEARKEISSCLALDDLNVGIELQLKIP